MEKGQPSRFHTGRAPEANQFEAPTARRQGKKGPKQLGSILSSRRWTSQA
jgi:hypothetical protein